MSRDPGPAGAGIEHLAERYRDRRVLITGGLGFIGWSLAPALVLDVRDALVPA